jgi:ribulose-phosphate 3-epimerase
LQHIKSLGKKAGVVVNPATPVSSIEDVLGEVDLILLMTVNPGFGGQEFIKSVVPKIKKLSAMLKERGLAVPIQIDGGINPETAKTVKDAGATILVAGNYIFKNGKGDGKDAARYAECIEALKKA